MYQKDVNGKVLQVKETADYRWFEYGGKSVQSLMNKLTPEQIVTPVCQSLLLFVLLQSKPFKVLNLGLGGGDFERTLSGVPNISLTSIEASQSIIDISKKFFYLPSEVKVICQQAEQFIYQTESNYDVIICDLFIGESNPAFIFTSEFYKQLGKITNNKSLIMVNFQVNSEQALLSALLAIKQYFPHIALIEFKDYSNIVVMCCKSTLTSKDVLEKRLTEYKFINFTDLNKAIHNMIYIP